ncbi:unnamed protein product [Prorocentrum cordatum]|uniref:Uncharacterized protein n=1 Tax=Prorocentrum cordatum TaxID=2364126 RepID=A0ABN9WIZ8_9DINO|nr:unnamed protein product [Polarella glacialis]
MCGLCAIACEGAPASSRRSPFDATASGCWHVRRTCFFHRGFCCIVVLGLRASACPARGRLRPLEAAKAAPSARLLAGFPSLRKLEDGPIFHHHRCHRQEREEEGPSLAWHRSDVCIFPSARTIEEHP